LTDEAARHRLVELLEDWTRRLQLPRLGAYSVQAADIPRVVKNCRGSSMKTNPVLLTDAEVSEVLHARI
jgi:alcohol dehydrogenase